MSSSIRSRMNQAIENMRLLNVPTPNYSPLPPTPYEEFIQVWNWQAKDDGLELVEMRRINFNGTLSIGREYFYRYAGNATILFSQDLGGEHLRWLNLYINQTARGTGLCRRVMELVFKCCDIANCPAIFSPNPYSYPHDNPDLMNIDENDLYFDRDSEAKDLLSAKYIHIESTLSPVKWFDGKTVLKYVPKDRASRQTE